MEQHHVVFRWVRKRCRVQLDTFRCGHDGASQEVWYMDRYSKHFGHTSQDGLVFRVRDDRRRTHMLKDRPQLQRGQIRVKRGDRLGS